MIKKFVSNALLSIVMDKDARKKLQNKNPKAATTPKTGTTGKPRQPLPDNASGEDVVETIAQALAEARAEVSGKPRVPRKAKRTRSVAPAPARKSTATPEREQLIQQAMAIHREKSHVLDELDPALREKLMVMAMYAMDPSTLPPDVRKKAKTEAEAETGAQGLVDDIGANPLSPGKRRRR